MEKLKTIALFLVFIIGFGVASTFRFQHMIYEQNHSPKILFTLLFIAMLSGIAFILIFKVLKLLKFRLWENLVYGAAAGIAIFFAVFGLEDIVSSKRLFDSLETGQFSILRGHCGVHAGRAMIRFYHRVWDPTVENLLTDFKISNHCRSQHFEEMTRRSSEWCTDSDETRCVLKWMNVFAEKGYWNTSARKLFLAKVRKVLASPGQQRTTDQALMEYAVRDQELGIASPDLFKQAGILEQFSDVFAYYRQKEEYDSIVIAKTIADEIGHALHAEPTGEFYELSKKASFRYDMLSELEKEIERLHQRISYNPSL